MSNQEAATTNETPINILSEFDSIQASYKGHEIAVRRIDEQNHWLITIKNHWFLFEKFNFELKVSSTEEALRLAKKEIDKVHEHLIESKAHLNASKRPETTVFDWPTLWQIQSELGFVDEIGGDEYRIQTLEAIKSGKVKLWNSHLIVEVYGIETGRFILDLPDIKF